MDTKVKGRDWKRWAGSNSALIAFVVLFVLAVIFQGSMFLSFNNIINVLRNNSVIGIIALGMTLVIITGGIDLSVGSQLAFTGVIIIQIFNQTQSIVLTLAAGVIMALVLGIITGLLVAKFRIPAFITTLGSMSIYRSVAQYWLNGGGLTASGDKLDSYLSISNTSLFGVIPMPIIVWIVCAVLVYLFAQHTATGRHIYAVGSNQKAAELATVRVVRVKCFAYSILSLLVVIAAIVETSRLGSVNSASSGSSYEMDAIAAAVIGGTSMAGGKGKIGFTVLGTLTLGIINNMMNLMGVNSFLVDAIKGAIIIVAVLLQMVLNSSEK
ncbi:ribose ABC transporter permease [Faecalicatena contorta]|jgi:ribose transport system permease protein|uniref:ABC transporter permease n=1 Tax=Faecalicatena contorta TaxID=39482 RepID=UPI0031CFCD7B